MRRGLFLTLIALVGCVPAAGAATIESELRAPAGPLVVEFRALPGERNETRLLPRPGGVRITEVRGLAVTGVFCGLSRPFDVGCRPPAGIEVEVVADTGDRADSAYVRIGRADLGPGPDLGVGSGEIEGGPGDDELRGVLASADFSGGTGSDTMLGSAIDDRLAGDAGNDLIVGRAGGDRIDGGRGFDQLVGGLGRDRIHGGPGRDRIRTTDEDPDVVDCGGGRDRAYVSRSDTVRRCERVEFGWPD